MRATDVINLNKRLAQYMSVTSMEPRFGDIFDHIVIPTGYLTVEQASDMIIGNIVKWLGSSHDLKRTPLGWRMWQNHHPVSDTCSNPLEACVIAVEKTDKRTETILLLTQKVW